VGLTRNDEVTIAGRVFPARQAARSLVAINEIAA
jgi:hypothetical protein